MAISSPQLPRRGYTQQGRTTRALWYVFPVAHDFELHVSGQALISSIFTSHLTQLAILLFWSASHLFHIAWLGNFHSFVQAAGSGLRPSALSAHAIRDPHFGASAALSNASSLSLVLPSKLYQWYFTVGMTSESQLLHAAALLCATGTGLLVAAFFHSRAVING